MIRIELTAAQANNLFPSWKANVSGSPVFMYTLDYSGNLDQVAFVMPGSGAGIESWFKFVDAYALTDLQTCFAPYGYFYEVVNISQ